MPDREPLLQQPIHVSETFSRPPYDRPLPLPTTLPYRPVTTTFQGRPQRPDNFLIDSVHAPSRKPVPVATEPVGSAVGILTGPVPSWQRPVVHKNGDPTNFEKCKCSFSFNCKSPGIKFVSTINPYNITIFGRCILILGIFFSLFTRFTRMNYYLSCRHQVYLGVDTY